MGDSNRAGSPFDFAPGGGLQLAGALPLHGDEVLRAIVYNSAAGVTVTIAGRYIDHDGRIKAFRESITPTTDRVISTGHFQIGRGYLLNVQAYASAGAPRRGQCYVGVEISRGTYGAREPIATLVKDYVTEGQGIAWPGSPIRSSVEGPGVIRSITGTDPAAGADISETVPTNARWLLYTVYAELAADATVANRAPLLRIDDGSTAIVEFDTSAGFVTASQTRQLNWTASGFQGGNNVTSRAATLQLIPLAGGWRVRTITSGLQAGDNWGAPRLLVEEWIED